MKKIKKCKVRSCDRKVDAKGYCQTHYARQRRGKPIEPRCLWCKKKLPLGHYKFCNSSHSYKYCYHNNQKYRQKILDYKKENFTEFYFMGRNSNIFTNGCTKELKESDFVEKEKDRILKDCIKNPKKYLKKDK